MRAMCCTVCIRKVPYSKLTWFTVLWEKRSLNKKNSKLSLNRIYLLSDSFVCANFGKNRWRESDQNNMSYTLQKNVSFHFVVPQVRAIGVILPKILLDHSFSTSSHLPSFAQINPGDICKKSKQDHYNNNSIFSLSLAHLWANKWWRWWHIHKQLIHFIFYLTNGNKNAKYNCSPSNSKHTVN